MRFWIAVDRSRDIHVFKTHLVYDHTTCMHSAVEKEKLTPEFRADVQALRHHILQQTKAKETLTTRTSQTHATFDAYENRARNVKHTGKERSSASAAESTSTPGSNDDEQAGHDAASVESKTGEENEIENSGGDERANDGDQKAMASKSMTGQSLTTLVRFLVRVWLLG